MSAREYESVADLQARVAELEARVAELEQGGQPQAAGEVWGSEHDGDPYADAEVIQS